MRPQPLSVSEVLRTARACAVFRVGGCTPEYLRDLLAVLLEQEAPQLAAKLRGPSAAQVLALRADLVALPRQ
jgi:hypothetical protein